MSGKTDRPSKCELGFIRSAANRVVEIFTFRTTTPGLSVSKNGTTVTIDYTPGDGGGPGGDIEIPDVIGLEEALAEIEGDVSDLGTALAGKSDNGHGHAISDVTSLQSTLDGKAATSHTHSTSQVTGLDTALAGKAATSHSHAISDVTSLQSTLDGKAAASHTHSTSQVTGLDTALAGKAATSHGHAASDINSGTFAPARLPVADTGAIGGVMRNPGSSGEYIYGFDPSGAALYGEPVSGYRPNMNVLINGGFRVSQRGETFNTIADGAYCMDRWVSLCSSSGGTDVYRNYAAGIGEAVVEFNGSHKGGLLQLIEGQNIGDLLDQEVTLSLYFRKTVAGGGNVNIKADLLWWNGTEDAPTKDVVSNWNVGSTSLPTLATNWARCTGGSLSGTEGTGSVFTRSFTVPSTAQNLAVFIYANDDLGVASGDLFALREVQLELGSVSTPFQREIISEEVTRCQRYYEVVRYNSGTSAIQGSLFAGTTYIHNWYYKQAKRVQPTVTAAITGAWNTGVPTISAGIDHCGFARAGGSFQLIGTSGNIAIAADAELGV